MSRLYRLKLAWRVLRGKTVAVVRLPLGEYRLQGGIDCEGPVRIEAKGQYFGPAAAHPPLPPRSTSGGAEFVWQPPMDDWRFGGSVTQKHSRAKGT